MAKPKLTIRDQLVGTAIAVFVFSVLLAINVGQMLSLLLLPLSRKAFRRVNRGFADFWWGLCVDAVRVVYGTEVIVRGDDVPERENAIVVANHQSMADIAVLFFLARSKHRLGDLKWFVKDPLKYVPGVGWGMLFLGCLFVKRDWTADRAGIERTFSTVIKEQIPLWVISFSEGTRRTPDKAQASRSYADQCGLPPTDHVMIPRTKGFVATVHGLRSHCEAVYDVTIGYPGFVTSLWGMTCGQSRRFEIDIRRYPMAELPEDDPGLSAWLFERFREKDRRLAAFSESGQLTAEA